VLLFCGSVALAQVNEQKQDTKNYSIGKVQIKNPQSVLSAYTYDPVTDRYIYTNSVDGFPLISNILTQNNMSLVLKESMRDYFKKKDRYYRR
jgi:hypothetical protein